MKIWVISLRRGERQRFCWCRVYGRPELQAQRDQYHTLQELIGELEADLVVAINTRDGMFGTGPDDSKGGLVRMALSSL